MGTLLTKKCVTGTRAGRAGCRWVHRQTGSVIVVTVLSLVLLVGMLGFVADIGHLFVNKSRLQTLLDSVVLSAAYTLDSVDTSRCVHMLTAAQVTYDRMLNTSDYGELKSHLPSKVGSLTWRVADTLSKNSSDWKDPTAITADCPGKHFVRVAAPLTGLRSFFMQVPWGGDPAKSTAASAVAGITSCGSKSAPVFLCANKIPTDPGDPCGSDDSDASTCFGLPTGQEICSKDSAGSTFQGICASQPSGYSPGNFGWLDAGSGASALSDTMAGTSTKECTAENALNITQTGNVTSVADAFNKAKFGEIKNKNDWTTPSQTWIPPAVPTPNPPKDPTYCYRGDLWCPQSGSGPGATPNCSGPNTANQVAGNTNSCIGQNYSSMWGQNSFMERPLATTSLYTPWNSVDTTNSSNRLAAFSVANCSSLTSGKGVVDIIGHICVFYTRPLAHEGNTDDLIVELVGNCGITGPSYEPIRIVLYKDPFGGDS